jgi:hypothetical protein
MSLASSRIALILLALATASALARHSRQLVGPR